MKIKSFHLLFMLMLFFACHPKQTSKKQIEHKQTQAETKDVIPIQEKSKNKSAKAIKEKQKKEAIFCCIEEMPQFPGGEWMLQKFIYETLVYPESALKDSAQGKVYIHFVIDEDGNVCCPEVVRPVRYDLDQEALRIISLLPKFEYGAKLMGKPSKIWFTVPVNFKLEKSKSISTTDSNITDSKLDFKLYPNPAREFCKIEVSEEWIDKELIYNLFDLKGKLLAEGKIESTITEINTHELNHGIYMLRLISGVLKKNAVTKLVVER